MSFPILSAEFVERYLGILLNIQVAILSDLGLLLIEYRLRELLLGCTRGLPADSSARISVTDKPVGEPERRNRPLNLLLWFGHSSTSFVGLVRFKVQALDGQLDYSRRPEILRVPQRAMVLAATPRLPASPAWLRPSSRRRRLDPLRRAFHDLSVLAHRTRSIHILFV